MFTAIGSEVDILHRNLELGFGSPNPPYHFESSTTERVGKGKSSFQEQMLLDWLEAWFK